MQGGPNQMRKVGRIKVAKSGTGAVIAAAEYRVCNEDTFDELYRRLAAFVSSCA